MILSLREAARIIRSKNAGPFELTLDVLFADEALYRRVKACRAITAEAVAALYRIPPEAILGVVYFDPALAVKITMKRRIPSGAPGDGDVYGAQQHAPLLAMTLELPEDGAVPAAPRSGGGEAVAKRHPREKT